MGRAVLYFSNEEVIEVAIKRSYTILSAVIALWAGIALADGVPGVNWGGSYENGTTGTGIGQGLGAATTSTRDYTFDAVSDAAYRIPFGSAYSPSADSRYLAPTGKTGPLYTGLQLVNHSSTSAPTDVGIYRWSASTNPNQLQKTNPNTLGSNPMSMSVAYFVKKADFLNGLNSAGKLGFSDATDGAVLDAYVRNTNAATIGFLVQNGTRWYATVKKPAVNNAYAVLAINPYAADWYAFDPVSNQFLNVTNLGSTIAGSTFTNITAFGIYCQHMNFNGTVGNAEKFDVQGFSGRFTAVAKSKATLIDDALSQTVARQVQTLTRQLTNPYPATGLWRTEDFALGAYGLNTSNTLADSELIASVTNGLYGDAILGGSFHWHAYLQERIYFLYSAQSGFSSGRMSTNAEHAVLEMLWNWAAPICKIGLASTNMVNFYWGSENHHMQAWVSFWGAAQIFKNHPDYQNRTYADGSTPAQMAAAFDIYFKAYIRACATHGLTIEVASPTYAKYTVNTWYNLADFAEDPELKQLAAALLDIYWADWAMEQIDGVLGGSRHRNYPETSFNGGGGPGTGWYHFGVGAAPVNPHPGFMCAVTTLWRPSRAVVGLALDVEGRGSYQVVSRRPGLADRAPVWMPPSLPPSTYTALDADGGHLLRTTWVTPDFVMGMSQVDLLTMDDWSSASSQNHWNGVLFAGNDTARIFTQPYEPADGSVYNAEWGVQKRGVQILQRRFRSDAGVTRISNAYGQRIWFGDSLTRTESGGWIFAEAPQAYAAVRVIDSVGSWQDETNYPAQGKWLVLTNEFSPIIIEAAPATAFSSFSAFQSSILNNNLTVVAGRVDYRSSFYDTTLTLFSDQRQLPRVDGVALNLSPEKAYDSPYLRGDFAGGPVIIDYESDRMMHGVAPFADDAGTIYHWNFETNVPTVHPDSTNSIHQIADGKFGGAIRCDFKTGDQYLMTANAWPANRSTFRYQGWIRLHPGDAGGTLFHVYDQIYLSASPTNATFNINRSGNTLDTSATNQIEITASISTSNDWQYIEAVYDGAQIQLVTGIETRTAPGIGAFVPNQRNVFIGSQKNINNYVGDMDEVKISAFFSDTVIAGGRAQHYETSETATSNVIANFSPATGTGSKLVVAASWESNTAVITNVTYGSQNFTQAIFRNNGRNSAIWYLDAPSLSSGNVTVRFSAATGSRVGVLSLLNVAQGAPEQTSSAINSTTLGLTNLSINALVMGVYTENGAGALSSNFGNTLYSGDSNSSVGNAGYQVEAVAGAKIYTWSATTSGCVAVAASFSPRFFTPTIAADNDNDGMADDWEIQHFRNLGFSDGTSDTDGDSFTDRQEFIAGTDPWDATSRLELTGLVGGSNLFWKAVQGKSYSVFTSTNLVTGPWSKKASGIPGTPPESRYVITNVSNRLFLRIETE